MNYYGLQKTFLDPRTKLFLLIFLPLLAVCAYGKVSIIITGVICMVPFLLLTGVKYYRLTGVVLLSLYCIMWALVHVLLSDATGGYLMVRLVVAMIFGLLLPGLTAAFYLKKSTSDTAFLGALYKLHLPRIIIIPLIIIFRYFPIITEEYRRIRSALKLRGITGFTNTLIPLIINAVQLSSEVSSAAMLRGIDSPCRTCVDDNHITIVDILLYLAILLDVGVILWEHFYA